eukprot:356778-Chlamydomonas_euryale.AAC.11
MPGCLGPAPALAPGVAAHRPAATPRRRPPLTRRPASPAKSHAQSPASSPEYTKAGKATRARLSDLDATHGGSKRNSACQGTLPRYSYLTQASAFMNPQLKPRPLFECTEQELVPTMLQGMRQTATPGQPAKRH